MFGKPFKFTPTQAPMKGDKPADSESGFLGVLENGAIGDETGLPPGKYNLYFANVNGQIKGYAEANGRIVKEAIRATSTPAAANERGKPQFGEKGWWVSIYKCAAESNLRGEWAVWCRWVRVYF